MKIHVDWFKQSGKWYTGGLVEVGDFQIWEDEFTQAIVDNQNELVDAWVDHSDYYVICSNTKEQDEDPNFNGFYNILFKPGFFMGMTKSKRALEGGGDDR